MKPQVLDLSWGDPVIVREALVKVLGISTARIQLESIKYTPHSGDLELIEQCKNLAERQSGYKPKHLFITCGATGGINAALYALKTDSTEWVITNSRHYPLYPSMINSSGLKISDRSTHRPKCFSDLGNDDQKSIYLVDSPSAPGGLLASYDFADIWDAAYASTTYHGTVSSAPSVWRIMVGSLSKTLGLSGLRLGWVSTDDDELAEKLKTYIEADYAGLSSVSMDIAKSVLRTVNLEKFEYLSSKYLNENRKEMQKLFDKFNLGKVSKNGMFAVLKLNKKIKKALEKANIKWQPGSSWGETDEWARLSIGQSREVVKTAVKRVLKAV